MLTLIKQLLKYAKANKKFWMVPAILMLILIGGLVIVVQSSAIAPFIYALF